MKLREEMSSDGQVLNTSLPSLINLSYFLLEIWKVKIPYPQLKYQKHYFIPTGI